MFLKIDFLTSMLLRALNMTLLSKVQQIFFQILWPSQKTQTLLTSKDLSLKEGTVLASHKTVRFMFLNVVFGPTEYKTGDDTIT